MSLKVLVTGGTGAVGKELCAYLTDQNFEVSILSRSKNENSNYKSYLWDYKHSLIDKKALKNCDYIVHLVGAGIADSRWTPERKREILDSRIKTTSLILKALSGMNHKVKAIISASAVGYYGQINSDKTFVENDAPGTDFVAKVCKKWEEESRKFEAIGIRSVQLRIGIVLMKKGGALEKMAQPFKYNVGAILASGKQIIPWIHIEDLIKMIHQGIQSTEMRGPYNACSPQPVDNSTFSKLLAKTLGKPIWLPNIPGFVLKIILGKRSVLATRGSRVSSEKISDTGFKFSYPELEPALSDLLN
ncbi:TIGR01777 family oxidoreductase [Lutimonas zeaxanthinifaciens]|uniref:TIGR01777 family oxidoreductase n=1 Tax=Lutimonas zeaxanthinifaciens TaxID=3060215 RepID=UPI00265D5BD4|nr:TIGR01777 family oxidoreductase [Lutimonas sp. YSD2104]WKK65382.1 TIGR01777 family oxidoreductase [Lutimonas sp. YSD2104]